MIEPTFVIDASVVLAWNDPRENNAYADKILSCLEHETAVTPQLCCLEVNNVLRMFEKNGLITSLDVEETTAFIDRLPIVCDEMPISFTMPLIVGLSRAYHLTIYDACYLELAVRLHLPLASLDKQLIAAVKTAGLTLKTV